MDTTDSARRKSLFLALALSVLFVWAGVAVAGQEVILITSPGCTKCAAAGRVLDDVIGDYEGYSVREEMIRAALEGEVAPPARRITISPPSTAFPSRWRLRS